MNLRRLLPVVLSLAAGWLFACRCGAALGAVYTWEGGDGGMWDTLSYNAVWWTGTPPVVPWSNALVNDALFSTPEETVFVDAPVTVQTMTFAADGYLLYGDSSGTITLSGVSPGIAVSAGAAATIYTSLTGTSGLLKSGNGLAELDLPNTYSGTTTVSGGVLRLFDANALPGGTGTTGSGNIVISGGVIELGVSDFTCSLGPGAGQVQFAGSGGFSAAGGNSWAVNLGGGSAQVAWGSGGFVPTGQPLVLGSPSDDSLVDFQNPINLNGQIRTVQARGGFAIVDARLSGALTNIGTGTGGLTVAGDGALELTASNNYTGPTTVSGTSVLRLSNSAALPGGTGTAGGTSNLVIDGGVIELAAGDFTRGLGIGGNYTRFTLNGGGFSASGGTRHVNLGGNSQTMLWGSALTPYFLPNGAVLVLGSPSDDAMVDFQNPISLNGATRTIQVNGGLAAVDAQISGSIVGGGTAGLTITGNGVLQLAASNTYAGTTTVSAATLRLSNSAALPGGTGAAGGTSNLLLDGGVVELAAGDFNRPLGTSGSQVQFTTAGGGFSAIGANRRVNFGGAFAPLTWGSAGFLPGDALLTLGSAGADSTLIFQNPVQLSSSTGTIQVTAGTAAVDAQLSGAISGTGTAGLTITGNGVLELTASNGYAGATTVSAATLRLSNSAALPGGTGSIGGTSNLVLDGSVVELAAGDFTRGVGMLPSQLHFTANGGGFSAVGANRNVNLGGGSAQVTWGSASFLPIGAPLILGSAGDDSTVVFQNPISLASSTGTIQVRAGTAAVDARLTGTISGSGTAGLTKTGYGTLELTAGNTYTGATTVSGGALRLSNSGALPGGTTTSGGLSNLVLDGGVVELAAGDFTRGAGTAASQVQFTTNGGGFSALGANRNVNLGGAAAQLTWSGLLPSGGPLILGSPGDDSTVTFQNPLVLDSPTGTVQVNSGAAPLDAQLAGALSGTGGLTKTGYGALDLTASNSYTGPTTVSAGILRLSNTAALPGGTASLGGTSNLVLDGGVIELASGNFARSIGTAAGQVQFTANGGGFGALGGTRTVNLGGGSAQVAWGSSGFVPAGAALVLGAISSDSLVDFQNPINLTSSGGTVEADAGASLVNGRLSGLLSGAGGFTKIGFGTLELTANNTYSGATTVVSGVLRLSNSGALPGGTANTGGASNLVLDGGVVELASSDFTRSLGTGAAQVQFVGRGGFSAAGAGHFVNLGGGSAQVTWGSGAFVPSGQALVLGSPSDDSLLDFQNPINLGNATQTIEVDSRGTVPGANISGAISGSGGLIKTGPGVLTLSATNSFLGGTFVSEGTLVVSNRWAIADGTNLTVGGSAIFAAYPAGAVVGVPTASDQRPVNSLTDVASPVPEPGTSILAAVVLAGVAWRKRRRCFRK